MSYVGNVCESGRSEKGLDRVNGQDNKYVMATTLENHGRKRLPVIQYGLEKIVRETSGCEDNIGVIFFCIKT